MITTGPHHTHQRWPQRAGSRSTCDRVVRTLQQLCAAYNLTHVDIARDNGIALSSVNSLLSGMRFPTIADLDAFGRVLGVPGSDILRAAEVES